MANQQSAAVIVGAGLMGRWHAYYLRQLGIPVHAIVDSDATRARALASRSGAQRSSESTEDLPGGSVWHICTPPPTHRELIERALDAGAHALVEKPLCPDFEEPTAVLNKASERKLLVCPVHQFLWQRGMLRVFRFVEALGDIRHLRMTVFTAGAVGRDEAGMDAVVADVLPHPLSLLVRLTGVNAQTDLIPVRAAPGEMMIAGRADGISVDVHVSTRARPTRCDAELTGTRGSARLNFFHGYGLFDAGTVSRWHKLIQPFSQALHGQGVALSNLLRRAVTREPAYPGLRELIRRFYRAADGHGSVPIPAAETRRVSELRDALLRRVRND